MIGGDKIGPYTLPSAPPPSYYECNVDGMTPYPSSSHPGSATNFGGHPGSAPMGFGGPFLPSHVSTQLDTLAYILNTCEYFTFFQYSNVDFIRRTQVIQLQTENGQPLLSIQHTPGQSSTVHDHGQGNRVSSNRIFEKGSITNFTDPSGRLLMIAAEGDGGSNTTTICSGDFTVGFMEVIHECCTCSGFDGADVEGKNAMGQPIVRVLRFNGGFKFIDVNGGQDLGSLQQFGNNVRLSIPLGLDVKVKGIVLTIAFSLHMRNFVMTSCGCGMGSVNKLQCLIVVVVFVVIIVIGLSIAGSTGGFGRHGSGNNEPFGGHSGFSGFNNDHSIKWNNN